MMDVARPMTRAEPRSSLMHRYLDPATSLAEVLFGLIMTLTFTLGAGIMVEDEGREGARQLLIAVVGCNVAWGIIDGALYIVGQLFARGRIRRLARAVHGTPDDQRAVSVVANELDGFFGEIAKPAERDALYLRVASHLRSRSIAINSVRKDDVMGAFTSFWLVVLTSVPAAIPFLLFDNARLALRVSNAILLALLFITGWLFARFTLGKPWIVGLSFLIGGAALVAVAIALGG
jgi:VIT1/CCC1 family predicted Fe2+/Mn2+ transporter